MRTLLQQLTKNKGHQPDHWRRPAEGVPAVEHVQRVKLDVIPHNLACLRLIVAMEHSLCFVIHFQENNSAMWCLLSYNKRNRSACYYQLGKNNLTVACVNYLLTA